MIKKKYFLNHKIALFFLTSLVINMSRVLFAETNFSTPEFDLLIVRENLKKIEERMNRMSKKIKGKNIQVNKNYLQFFHDHAKFDLKNNNCKGSIYWNQRLLKNLQHPGTRSYLQIHHDLTKCHLKIGMKAKALESLRKYVHAFFTSRKQNFKEIKSLFSDLYEYSKTYEINFSDLSPILSSLAHFSVPNDLYIDLSFNTIKILIKNKNFKEAYHILKHTRINNHANNHLNDQLTLYKSIILAAQGLYKESEHNLIENMELISNNIKLKPYLHLTLGRIYFHLKKYEMSEDHLMKSNELGLDVTYELFILYARKNEWNKSRHLALNYLSNQSYKGQDYYELKSLIPWLYLKSGDLTYAKEYLESSIKKLNRLKRLLFPYINNKIEKYNYLVFQKLEAQIMELVPLSPLSHMISNLRRKLDHLQDKKEHVINDLDRNIYYLSSHEIKKYIPKHYRDVSQVNQHINLILNTGRRLVHIESLLMKDKLSISDLELIKEFNTNEEDIFNPTRISYDFFKAWEPQYQVEKTLAGIKKFWSKINHVNASNNASLIFSKLDSRLGHKYLNKSKKYARKIDNIFQEQKNYYRELSLIKLSKRGDVIKNHPLHVKQNLLYDLIKKQSKIVKKYHSTYRSLDDKETIEFLNETWRQWELLYKNSKDTRKHIINNINTDINSLIQNSVNRVEGLSRLDNELHHVMDTNHRLAEKAVALIAAEYNAKIENLLSKYTKWISDINWKQSILYDKEKKHLGEELQIKINDYNQSFFDFKNGKLIQWEN